MANTISFSYVWENRLIERMGKDKAKWSSNILDTYLQDKQARYDREDARRRTLMYAIYFAFFLLLLAPNLL